MLNHPEYRSNQMYVGGDSYSGIVVPLVLQHILDGTRPHLATFIIGVQKFDDSLGNIEKRFTRKLGTGFD